MKSILAFLQSWHRHRSRHCVTIQGGMCTIPRRSREPLVIPMASLQSPAQTLRAVERLLGARGVGKRRILEFVERVRRYHQDKQRSFLPNKPLPPGGIHVGQDAKLLRGFEPMKRPQQSELAFDDRQTCVEFIPLGADCVERMRVIQGELGTRIIAAECVPAKDGRPPGYRLLISRPRGSAPQTPPGQSEPHACRIMPEAPLKPRQGAIPRANECAASISDDQTRGKWSDLKPAPGGWVKDSFPCFKAPVAPPVAPGHAAASNPRDYATASSKPQGEAIPCDGNGALSEREPS